MKNTRYLTVNLDRLRADLEHFGVDYEFLSNKISKNKNPKLIEDWLQNNGSLAVESKPFIELCKLILEPRSYYLILNKKPLLTKNKTILGNLLVNDNQKNENILNIVQFIKIVQEKRTYIFFGNDEENYIELLYDAFDYPYTEKILKNSSLLADYIKKEFSIGENLNSSNFFSLLIKNLKKRGILVFPISNKKNFRGLALYYPVFPILAYRSKDSTISKISTILQGLVSILSHNSIVYTHDLFDFTLVKKNEIDNEKFSISVISKIFNVKKITSLNFKNLTGKSRRNLIYEY